MFDIGFWELLLIGVVALLVVGPDRLPEVARTAGKWVLKTRRFVAGVKSDFQSELESGDLHKILGDQRDQIKELRSMVDSTRRDIETSTSSAVTAAKKGLASMEASASDNPSDKNQTSDNASSNLSLNNHSDVSSLGEVSSNTTETSTTDASTSDTRSTGSKTADTGNKTSDISRQESWASGSSQPKNAADTESVKPTAVKPLND